MPRPHGVPLGWVGQAQAHALVPRRGVPRDDPDQLGRLGGTGLPAREGHGAVGGQVAACRLGDGRGLPDQRASRELARVQVQVDPLSQRDGQHGEGAEVASELEIPRGELMPALVVPQIVGAVTGDEGPADLVFGGDVAAASASR
jgi:hypothetical protein